MSQAVYEWDYARQLLHLRAAEATGGVGPGGRGRALQRALPGAPAAAAGHRPVRRTAAGPAHRRGRPGRRRVRGLPARDPVRVRGHHPRAGHLPGRGPAARHHHLQPDPRRPRRPQAALPLPLGRAPRLRARGGHRAPAGPAGRPRLARQVAGAVELDAGHGALQAAGCGRDHRLGRGPGRPRAGPSSTSTPSTSPSAPSSSTRRTRSGSVPRASTSWSGPPWSGVAEVGSPQAARWAAASLLSLRTTEAGSPAPSAWWSPSRGCCGAPASTSRPATSSPSPRPSARSACPSAIASYWAGRATLVHRPEDIAVYDRVFASFWLDQEPLVAASETASVVLALDMTRTATTLRRIRPGRTRRRLPPSPCATAPPSAAPPGFRRLHRRRLGRRPTPARRAPHRHASGASPGGMRPTTRRRGRPDLGRTVRRALDIGRRADPAGLAGALRPAPPAGAAGRHLRVDGALRPGPAALRPRRGRAPGGRGRSRSSPSAPASPGSPGSCPWRDPDAALADAGDAVADWSGGTRLGDGLREFNDRWGCRGMARGAVVVILSDGWDRGDPADLGAEMARLHRVAHRVVWVNPLESVTRIRAAGPRDGRGPSVC